MEKVRPWCGQPSDRGRLKIRSDSAVPLIASLKQEFVGSFEGDHYKPFTFPDISIREPSADVKSSAPAIRCPLADEEQMRQCH